MLLDTITTCKTEQLSLTMTLSNDVLRCANVVFFKI